MNRGLKFNTISDITSTLLTVTMGGAPIGAGGHDPPILEAKETAGT